MAAWCDRLLLGGVAFALVFGPFAFGAVHPPAYGFLEILACLLVMAWVVRVRFSLEPEDLVPVLSAKVWVPFGGFLALVAIQLVPLPPAVLSVVSPSTYEIYATALPGWPSKAPYEEFVRELLARDERGVQAADLHRPVALPATGKEEPLDLRFPGSWAKLPGEPLLDVRERERLERWVERGHVGTFSAWRSISVDPARTWAELLKILAYFGFFCVVTLHPFSPGSDSDARLRRGLLWTAVATAVAVAVVALLQRFSWNGKILWFFVPWDWGAPRVDLPQTSGPFISRNNFGGYLALMLPLALGPVLAPSRIDLPLGRRWTRVVFGTGAALIAVSLLFSLSRGSWLAAGVGVGILLGGIVRRIPPERRARLPSSRRGWAAAAVVVFVAIFVLLRVPTGGPLGGNEIDRRLRQTVRSSASWDNRVEAWRDSLPMVADFPALGVGLGSWGTIFPRYDESLFFGSQARRAHNDYLQALVETGVVGAALLLALGVAVGRRLLASRRDGRTGGQRVVSLAIVAGLCALLTHELVDFDLQMPGIALTAAVLVALALRGSWRRAPVAAFTARTPYWATALGMIALVGVVRQPTEFLPRIHERTPSALLQTVARHPLRSESHMQLAASTVEYLPSPAPAETAIALNPSNPAARDVRTLLAWTTGDEETAMAQLEESFFRAPSRRLHPLYFHDTAPTWSDPERAAIRAGFERAIREVGFRPAYEFAQMLRESAEPHFQGEAWKQVARLSDAPRDQAIFLRAAATQFVDAGELDEAEKLLSRARRLSPQDVRVWTTLVSGVFGGRKDMAAAERAVAEAKALGVPPFELEIALADVARRTEDSERERELLRAAAALRPSDPRVHFLLGHARYRAGVWDGAARAFRRAVELKPAMAESWYYLGHSDAQRYAFSDALADYRQAIALSPADRRYQRSFVLLEERVRQGSGGVR